MEDKTSGTVKIGTPFLDTPHAADYLLISVHTLKNHRILGSGPKFRRHGGRIVYHRDDLDQWSEENSVCRKY